MNSKIIGYRVRGNYTPKCAYDGLDLTFDDLDTALECHAMYVHIFDWIMISRIYSPLNTSPIHHE